LEPTAPPPPLMALASDTSWRRSRFTECKFSSTLTRSCGNNFRCRNCDVMQKCEANLVVLRNPRDLSVKKLENKGKIKVLHFEAT